MNCYLDPMLQKQVKGYGGNATFAPRLGLRRANPAGTAKPHIPVTLICVDTTHKADLARRAIRKCLEQATFAEVKLLTTEVREKFDVKINPIEGMAAYSRFMIKDLVNYVGTSHALVVQWDGYIVDGSRWRPDFLSYDYIGAPWWQWHGLVGNGGFSLRSLRLLQHLAATNYGDPHPEDSYICMRFRAQLEQSGMRFAPAALADRFAIESRAYDGRDWHGTGRYWNDHFGFHSYLTPLPEDMDRPWVFHHGGDFGDVIYALPTIKALGGGVLFLSPDNRHPYPAPPHGSVDPHWAGNIIPLLNQQDYIWQALHTGALPHSTDFDLNAFRDYYKTAHPDNWRSIYSLHKLRFGVGHDETKPWLKVDRKVTIPGRPIVVSRTQRYQNDWFPWGEVVKQYGQQMVFVGSNQEYEFFKGFCPQDPPPQAATESLLDVARLIAGAKVMIGNQSAPMAIALGLGQNIIQECWPQNANCQLTRNNAIYWLSRQQGAVGIPAQWLA